MKTSMRTHAQRFCTDNNISALPYRMHLDHFCLWGRWPDTDNGRLIKIQLEFERYLKLIKEKDGI